MADDRAAHRLMCARRICEAGWRHALTYLEEAGDPRPAHTAAQAMWQVAIERAAAALRPANDTGPRLPTRFGEDLLD